jgi:hypothetical protein
MSFQGLPARAAWQHRDVRMGFEVLFARRQEGCHLFEGATAAVEEDQAWAVDYAITVDEGWMTQSALVIGRSASGSKELRLEADGAGGWRVDGVASAHLDGCLDVDLESSALTNAFPVHRLGLEIGQEADAPAAYVRAIDLTVERLEQRYVRIDDDADGHQRFEYSAPSFGFECQLVYDVSGLVLQYPGIAVRAV